LRSRLSRSHAKNGSRGLGLKQRSGSSGAPRGCAEGGGSGRERGRGKRGRQRDEKMG